MPDIGSTDGTERVVLCFSIVICAGIDMPGMAISEDAEIPAGDCGDESCNERDISGAINNISIARMAITAGSLACDNRIRNDK